MSELDTIHRLLIFPFYVTEGINQPEPMAKRLACSKRQVEQYRQALERMGFLVSSPKNSPYELTELGRLYMTLDTPENSFLIIRRLLAFPVLNEILIQLIIRPSHSLTTEDVNMLVEEYTRSGHSQSFIERDAKVLHRYLKWMAMLSVLRIDKKGTIGLPAVRELAS